MTKNTVNFSNLSDDELMEKKIENLSNLSAIKSQVTAARAEAAAFGKYSDITWFNKAKDAMSICGVIDQAIAIEFRRRRPVAVVDLGNAFIDVARDRLSESEFESILSEAKIKVKLHQKDVS